MLQQVFRIQSVVLLLEREAKSDENIYRNTRGEAKSDNNEKHVFVFERKQPRKNTFLLSCILILGVNFLPDKLFLLLISSRGTILLVTCWVLLRTLGCPAP